MSELEKIFQEGEEVKDEQVTKIGELVKDLQEKEKAVKDAEQAVKDAKKELTIISQEIIPAMLDQTGFSEIRLKSGEFVVVQEKLKVSILKNEKELAYQAMIKGKVKEEEGMSEELAKAMIDSLFKNQVIIDKPTPELEQLLLDHDYVFNKVKDIHWKTLESYCKGLKERGVEIPEHIKSFEYRETSIKKKK